MNNNIYKYPSPTQFLQKNRVRAFLFAFCSGYIFALLFELTFLSALAVIVFLLSLTLFTLHLGNTIPIKSSIFLLAALQWLLGPVLEYQGLSHHYKYYQYVPIEEYMPFAIMGTLAFAAGMFIFDNKKQYHLRTWYLEKITNNVSQKKNLPYYIIGLGIITSLLNPYMPGPLRFVFYLLGNLKYIGVIYLLFTNDRHKYFLLAVVIFFTFTSSLNKAMFHGLLLWLMFLGVYIFIIKNFSLGKKIVILTAGLLFVVMIQIVKHEFRQYIWFSGYGGSKVGLFFELVGENLWEEDEEGYTEYEMAGSTRTESVVVRINQGWIISRIMDYIPRYEPFLKGESVRKALYASIVPRFIDPNKQVVGGQDYFPRFTGYALSNTSMGASLLGEGYANYGKTGAVIFVFIIGLIYGLIINWVYNLAIRYPTLLLWLPLLFFQVVKAESDLVRVLNHLTKTGILMVLLYGGARMFGVRL